MTTLRRRLTALEETAERVRLRSLSRRLEDDARAANMRPERIPGHVARLLAIDRKVQAWLAAGLSRDDIVRRCAVEIGVDPEILSKEMAEKWERETGGAAWRT